MNKPYLIQRAKFENNNNKKGIDSMLNFDYMGSAEFEFGALPASLKQIRENVSNYESFNYTFKKNKSKIVTIFCRKEDKKEIEIIIEELSNNKIQLKEYCDLSIFVNDRKDWKHPNDFWWDIRQDWMFWKHTSDKFDNQLITLIKYKDIQIEKECKENE